MTVFSISSTSDLSSYDNSIYDTLVVTDVNTGGVFCFTAASGYAADPGVVFAALHGTGWWIRQYDVAEGVNVMWFGLAGDGVTDDSIKFQAAYNAGYNIYNFPVRDFLMGNINLSRPNVCLRSESAIYDTQSSANKGTRIFLSAPGVIFYTTADITGSRFYGLRLDGSLVTSGNCRGMIIGIDDSNVDGSSIVNYPVPPYTGYSPINLTVIKCSFEFMEFFNFRQEGWLGENVDGAIIRSCYTNNCLSDISYLTEYRAAIAVYGDDCLIERTEAGQWKTNAKSQGAISISRFNILTISSASPAVVTTTVNHGYRTGDKVTIFDIGGGDPNWTPINKQSYTITVNPLFPTTFTLNGLNAFGFATYSSLWGGIVSEESFTGSINTVTAMSPTATIVTTPAALSFSIGDRVTFDQVSGMISGGGVSINGVSAIVTAVSATQITLNFDATGYSSYSGGGIISENPLVHIANISQASNAVITTTDSSPLAIGDIVVLNNVMGMVSPTGIPISGQSVYIKNVTKATVGSVTTTSITVSLDTSLYTAYTMGGIVSAQIRACGIGMFGGSKHEGTWLNFCDGELCDAGIYVGHQNVKITSCRNDRNAGLGFIIDGDQCQVSNSSSYDNGSAMTNAFDGFLITSNSKGSQFSNCLTHTDTMRISYQSRYGFNDLSFQGDAAGKTVFSNCKSVGQAGAAFNFGFPSGAGARSTENGPEIAFAAGDTMPNVSDWGMWVTANTSTTVTAITNFTGGFPGQVIYVRINDIFTTIQSGVLIQNKNGLNISGAGVVLQYKYDSGVWYQVVDDHRGIIFTQTTPQPVTSSMDTSILGPPPGITFPANFFSIGRVVRVKIVGFYLFSTTSTMTVRIYYAGVSISHVLTGNLPVAASNFRFTMEATITCINVSMGSGTFYIDSVIIFDQNTAGSVLSFTLIPNTGIGNTSTLGISTSQLFDITAAITTGAGTLQSNIAFVEIVN